MSVKLLKIKDFTNVITGGTPSSTNKEFWENGNIPWLNSGELNQGIIRSTRNHITKSGLDSSSAKMMPEDSVLMALTGATTGVVGYLTFEACANQSVTGILPSERHRPKYLYYYLKSIRNKVIADAYGGAQPHISQGYVKDILVPLPPLEEQKKTAAILDAAYDYRQKTKALIEKYDQLTHSLFLDMFGDPVTNPKGWEVVKFSDVGNLDRGKSKHRPRNAPELLGGDHPLIQTGDLANCGTFLRSFKSTYSDIGLAQSKKWPPGTLCITIAANIAKTGILTFNACFPDSIVGFVPNEKTNTIYSLFWLSFLQKILEENAPESAQKNINLAILRALDFPLPEVKLQNEFAERIEQIENQKQQAEASLVKAEELFNSLLQRAFKGELTN